LGILTYIILISGIQLASPSISNEENPPKTQIRSFERSENFPKLALNSEKFSHYDLSVKLNEIDSTVIGELNVEYYNDDSVEFTRIPFHLYLSGMMYKNRRGNIEILSVVDAFDSSNSLSFEIQNQIVWVELADSLGPNQKASFIISFISTLPDGGFDRANSHGADANQSRIYTLTSFYPMPCVYDEFDGWNIDEYLEVGDPFYFDMAYYDLIVEVPNGMIVAATGELVSSSSDGTTSTYHYDPIYPVREVTFSASRYFEVQSEIVDNIKISTYFLPKSQFLWKNEALETAINSIALFSKTFGPYPYSTFNVVEFYSIFYGMEYPLQVYIGEYIDHENYNRFILEKTIVHETAHQWWYNLVGVDQVDWGFLDEGLTCWSTDYYGEVYHYSWAYFQYPDYFDAVRLYYAENNKPSKINQSVYECIDSDSNFVFIAYRKTPLILEKLRMEIGNSTFISGLKLFFEQYQFKNALLSDMQLAFELQLGKSLDWFFLPWFNNPYIPNYIVENIIYNGIEKILKFTVKDINEEINDFSYSQKIPIIIFDSKGHYMLNDEFWVNGTTEFSIPLDDEPDEIWLTYKRDVIAQLNSIETATIKIKVLNIISSFDILIVLAFLSVSALFVVIKIVFGRKKRFSIEQ
jgi:hypothetical protein